MNTVYSPPKKIISLSNVPAGQKCYSSFPRKRMRTQYMYLYIVYVHVYIYTVAHNLEVPTLDLCSMWRPHLGTRGVIIIYKVARSTEKYDATYPKQKKR